MADLPIPHSRRLGLRPIGSLIAAAALVTAQLGIAAAPVLAVAPSLVVTADNPAAVPAGHNWSFNDFFPRVLSVPQGSTIGFAIEGFHTATLLPAGTTAAQDLIAHGIAQADADDTTPNLNGSSHIVEAIPNVLPIPGGCGTATTPCAFDGSGVVSSGAPFGPPAGPFLVTVTAAPGTYVFHCRVHPGMNGTLTVVASTSAGTTPADLASAVAAQTTADVAAGHAAEAAASAAGVHHNADGTTTWTLSAGTSDPDGHVAILEMLPSNVTVKAGDTVSWRSRTVNEPHTVTFPTDPHAAFVPLCEAGAIDTPATPTVIPPTSPLDFACGTGPANEVEAGGGNGITTVTTPSTVSDSGFMAASNVLDAFGLPATAASATWSVRFTGAVAGTYTYVCQIHDGMKGTITIAAPKPPTPVVTPPPTTTGPITPVDGSTGLGSWALVLVATIGGLVATTLTTRRRSRR